MAMGVTRRPKLLYAAVVICIFLFLTWHYDAIPDIESADRPNGAPVPPLDDKGKKLDDAHSPSGSDGNAPNPAEPALAQDAHKLPTADDFKPHFQAVMLLPGITMADAKSTCLWGPAEKVNFQYGTDKDWVTDDRPDQELEQKRREWHTFVESGMIPYSQVEGRFNGRGLVIVAGNADTLMRVKVILRALVRLNSVIPVEIHYWDDEMDMGKGQELLDIYPEIYFNDLSKDHNILHIKKDGFFGINYQLKTASLINSRFAEPILLDSDNIPVIDPATLYDSDEYKEYGTIFWPDIARTRPNNPAWAITNTPCRMDEYEQESGQLLVDKRRFFYHLQLASWLNNEQGAYYNEFLLGAKDMFRFAWHALKTRYGKPKRWLTSLGTVNGGFYCGHSFAQHHPDSGGKIAFVHGGLTKTTDLEVMRWQRDKQGGYYRNYKLAPSDEDPMQSVNVAIKFDAVEYMPNKPGGTHVAMCTDLFDVEPKNIDEILPGFERIFDELGGYWKLDEADKAKAVDAKLQETKEKEATDKDGLATDVVGTGTANAQNIDNAVEVPTSGSDQGAKQDVQDSAATVADGSSQGSQEEVRFDPPSPAS